jgi:hypothetical protein
MGSICLDVVYNVQYKSNIRDICLRSTQIRITWIAIESQWELIMDLMALMCREAVWKYRWSPGRRRSNKIQSANSGALNLVN